MITMPAVHKHGRVNMVVFHVHKHRILRTQILLGLIIQRQVGKYGQRLALNTTDGCPGGIGLHFPLGGIFKNIHETPVRIDSIFIAIKKNHFINRISIIQ